MPLSPTTRLGPYEILSGLGAGGMGEVYKARDTRLDRIVAIKVLLKHRAASPQIRERFEREARAVSSLNHPHICTLYDVGHQDELDFLVMEYLEGETLAHRLLKGRLSLEHALQYAIQITDALDTAHKHGVIHRDLKPGNIMLIKTGAKLLDFGLAKVRAAEAISGITALPTQTTPLTGEGTILGTLQYMAPEQLEGKEVDARTDIFALGTVIYEMATGRKAFEGKSHASLIAAILEREPPPISSLETMTPSALDHLVRTCVAKDPDARWQTAHDVLVDLRWISEAGSRAGIPVASGARLKRRELIPWVLVAALVLVLAVTFFRQRPTEAHAMRFEVPLPDKVRFEWYDFPVISPNGQYLLLPGAGSDGRRHLWLRPLASLATKLLPGTEDAYNPFWSPDSRSIAFFDSDKLVRIDLANESPQALCGAPGFAGGGAWNQNGMILFSTNTGIARVPSAGGQANSVLKFDKSRQETAQLLPQFMPDGRHFLYLSRSADAGKTGIYVGSLDSPETRLLVPVESNASYVPPGFLVYGREEVLLAQPFDAGRLRVTGDAVQIADHVGRLLYMGASSFSVSQNGILVYGSPISHRIQFVWHNRDGTRGASLGEPGMYSVFALSPDGKRLALTRADPKTRQSDVWILETSSGILSRLTLHSAEGPAWSRDGRQMLISSHRRGSFDLYRKEVGGGEEELIFHSDEDKYASDWLNDGSVIFENTMGKTFYRLRLSGDGKPEVLLQTEFEKDDPRVSPDGRWIAYCSTESGQWEVFVAAFPSFKEKRQISNSGGCQPSWRRDLKELFYLDLQGRIISVEMKGGLALQAGAPRVLFQTPFRTEVNESQYEASGDGRRFLLGLPVGEESKPVSVVVNWLASPRRW